MFTVCHLIFYSMKITVAIPTNGLRQKSLSRLLDALQTQTLQPNEVIVVDAATCFKSIENRWPIVLHHVVADEPNLPLQRWQAVSIATGDIIAFFDDDVVPQSDYLQIIADLYKEDDAKLIGGIGGFLLHCPPQRKSLLRSIRLYASGISEQNIINRGGIIAFPNLASHIGELDAPALSGGAMSFRLSIIREIGPLPWLYELYRKKIGRAEDIILSAHARKCGKKLVLHPDAKVLHYLGEDGSAFSRKGYHKGIADTWGRYQSSRLVSERWSFIDQLAFLRYVIVLALYTAMLSRSGSYLSGVLQGLVRCCRGEVLYQGPAAKAVNEVFDLREN